MQNESPNVKNDVQPGPQARVVKVDPSHDMDGGVVCRDCHEARGEMLEIPCAGSNGAVCCAFMESKPEVPKPPFDFWQGKPSRLGWWSLISRGPVLEWRTCPLTLDKVRLVELALTRDLFNAYEAATFLAYADRMRAPGVEGGRFYAQTLMTLSADDKIGVLGPILRPLVVKAAGGL